MKQDGKSDLGTEDPDAPIVTTELLPGVLKDGKPHLLKSVQSYEG